MPVTPSFSLSQDDTYVYVTIRVPHIKVSSTEIHACGNDFSFYCKPYLLHLTLPYDVNGDDDERQRATYDADQDNGTLVAYLPKTVPGQYFPDLDLTTNILNHFTIDSKRGTVNSNPIIEVISSNVNNDHTTTTTSNDADDDKEEEQLIESTKALKLNDIPLYGFNMSYCNILRNLREECMDMIEITEPDQFPSSDRREYRLMMENSLFDASRYLGDLFEADNDPIYVNAMDWESYWNKAEPLANNTTNDNDNNDDNNNDNDDDGNSFIEHPTVFTKSEQQMMTSSLRNKEYLIGPGSSEEGSLLLGLVDIVFAFCYEFRITLGDLNVVSSFNISRLSATLSWFDYFDRGEPYHDTMSSIVRSCIRRSITYPYIRSWDYGLKILDDTVHVFRHGKRCILKCLLKLRDLFEHGDSHYLLNKLYINDYCVWIQTVSDSSVGDITTELSDAVELFKVDGKNEVGFHLVPLESWANDKMAVGDEGGDIPQELLKYELSV